MLLHPDAVFIINKGPSIEANDMLPMFSMRPAKVARFGHDTHVLWDMAHEDGSRTAMFESTSFTVFKENNEGMEVRVKEFNVVELVMCDSELKSLEVRTYMDPSPVSERAQAVAGNRDA